MDDLAMARWRMRTLRLSGGTFPSPAQAVEGMLGVQAENHDQASWAVVVRTGEQSRSRFQILFQEGQILRTHVLRPTWHFVRPADIRWLLETTAPRIRRSIAQLQTTLGLSDDDLAKSDGIIGEALSDGSARTRHALGERMIAAGLPAEGQRLGVMLMTAELAGLICSGPLVGGEHTYTLLEDRAPNAPRLDRDEALGELALRYFAGHGPATERDLSYWASLTLTDVRRGLAGVSGHLNSIEHEGRTFWFAESAPADTPPTPRAHIFQVLDEYHNGYQDSRHLLDPAGIVPRGRKANMGMVLVDAQMIGGMQRTIRAGSVRFEIDLFCSIDSGEQSAIEEAARRYGAYLELDAEISLRVA